MLIDDKKQAAVRMLIGGALGIAGCLLLGFLTQPGWLLGGALTWDFTFCYNARVPEALGAALGFLLWFLFGAEVGAATLPFAAPRRPRKSTRCWAATRRSTTPTGSTTPATPPNTPTPRRGTI